MKASVAFIVAAVGGALGGCAETRTPGASSRIDGAYVLERVNGVALPAPTWVRTKHEERCTVETLAGVVLMDSNGRWTALVTERDSCERSDGSRRVGPEKSSLLSGTYAQSGARLTLRSEELGTEDDGEFDGDRIVVKSVGIGDFAGQTSTYVVKRLQ